MEYNKIMEAGTIYNRILIEDNFYKYLHERNKINFYKEQTYYKNKFLYVL